MAVLTGSTLQVDNLVNAGVLESCCVLVLAGEGMSSSEDADTDMVLLVGLLEHLFHGVREPYPPFVMYEFRADSSVSLVPEVFQHHTDHPLPLQPCYRRGSLITNAFLGSIVGNMYYMPATIEIAEALSLPQRGKHASFCWQTEVPPYSFNEPFADLVLKSVVGWDGSELLSAIPLGLYRLSDEDVRYVVTNPPGDTIVRPDDLVIWVGDAYFGKVMSEQGLLLNSF